MGLRGDRATKALTAALIMFAAAGCSAESTVDPDGSMAPGSYFMARHVNLSTVPLGIADGTVALRRNCLYLGSNLLLWPEDYSLREADAETVVVGDGWTIAPGDPIVVSGGQYARSSDLPSQVIGGFPPCSGPYLWVADVLSVGPSPSS